MKNKSILILLAAVVSLPFGCKKDKKQTPAGNPTDYGKISFNINGTPWQSSPHGSRLMVDGDIYEGIACYIFSDTFILLGCNISDSSYAGIQMNKLKPGKIGVYEDSTMKDLDMIFIEKVANPTMDQVYVSEYIKIEITSWDPLAKRFSGTLQARLVSNTKTINLTYGKLDNVLSLSQ